MLLKPFTAFMPTAVPVSVSGVDVPSVAATSLADAAFCWAAADVAMSPPICAAP